MLPPPGRSKVAHFPRFNAHTGKAQLRKLGAEVNASKHTIDELRELLDRK